jgi:hypothetical protein
MIKYFSFLIYVILFFILGSLDASAKTYYVSPSGSDYSDGTESQPFKSIQKAADTVDAGDTVIVKDGIYQDTDSDSNVVYLTRGGSSSNWITFKAETKWNAVINGNATAQYGFSSKKDVAYIRIEDFEITNVIGTGISISQGGNSNFVIYRNKIHHIGGQGFYSGSYSPGYHIIDSNLIYDWGTITKNNLAHGIYTSADNLLIINNIFIQPTDTGVGWAITAAGIIDGKIVNNTFYGTNTDKYGHIVIWKDNSGLLIQNNIFHDPKGAGIYCWDTLQSINMKVKNNIFYPDVSEIYSGSGSEKCPSISTSNNYLNTDPQFVDASKRDYHLQSNSPAIDKGFATNAPDHDHDNNPRNDGKPDIGAYEYTGSAPPPPPDNVAPNPPPTVDVQ